MRRLILTLALAALGAAVAVADADTIRITPLARDGQVLISFEMPNGLSDELRASIRSGLPTSISYGVELRRVAPLFDRTIGSLTVTASVRFDNLTRRYQLSRTINGRVEDVRVTEDETAVRRWMTQFERLPLVRTTGLEATAEYYVRVRARTRPHNSWFFWPWDRWLSWPWDRVAWGQATFTFLP